MQWKRTRKQYHHTNKLALKKRNKIEVNYLVTHTKKIKDQNKGKQDI